MNKTKIKYNNCLHKHNGFSLEAVNKLVLELRRAMDAYSVIVKIESNCWDINEKENLDYCSFQLIV